MESVLAVFTVCLTAAFILSELAHRLRYPKVVGQLVAGMVLGLPFFDWFITDASLGFISSLSDIGVVFLILLVGTEVRIKDLSSVSSRAVLLALAGYVIPLLLGFLFMKAFGFSDLSAVIVGICLAISAEAITTDILLEYGLLRTRMGSTIMEAGMIDDFLGVFSLAAVIAYVQGDGLGGLAAIPVSFLAFIFISYVVGLSVLPWAARLVWREKSEAAVFSLAVIFGLIVVWLSNMFGLSSVIGAFVAGLIIQLTIKNQREEEEIVESLSIVTFGLVIPFFFINVGLSFDFSVLANVAYLVAGITFLGLAGKMAAAHIVGACYGISSVDRSIIGWGINPRGAVELVIVNIAVSEALISETVFSAVVAMAVIAAIVSPIMFRLALGRHHGKLR